MKIESFVYVNCDGDYKNCPEVFWSKFADAPSSFAQMREEGWIRKSGQRFCPNCVERYNIKGGF
jgi:hypothetical protein